MTSGKTSVVVDDNLEQLGLKPVTKSDDVSLRTSKKLVPITAARFTADAPGEYEISGFIINGVAARAHMDAEDETSAVIFTIATSDLKVVVLGHIYPELREEQLEQIGMVDIAFVPIGNSGYTMDGLGALKVIKQIEPKLIIPTHYADKAIQFEVPQAELSEGLKALGMEPSETVAKFKPKLSELTDATRLIILERQ